MARVGSFARRRELGDQPLRHARRQQRLAAGDGADGPDELHRLGVLDEEAAGAGAQRLEHVLVELERREDHDPHPRQMLVRRDHASGREAVEDGHANVHEHHFGYEALRQLHGRFAVIGLPDDLDVVLRIEQSAEAGADKRLIVCEQHGDHRAPSIGSSARTRKPPPGRGPISSRPPSAAVRSRMPAMPLPLPEIELGVPPRPSSSTWRVTSCSP